MLCPDQVGTLPRRALLSYVRNEPPHPPTPAWGTVESLRLMVISPSVPLSPCLSASCAGIDN